MSRYLRLRQIIAVLVLGAALGSAGAITVPSISDSAVRSELSEGLLIEADAKYGAQELAGRVLVQSGQTDWTVIASGKKTSGVRLEAQASLVDADVVQVKTRFAGSDGSIKQSGTILVRIGESARITQLEGDATTESPTAGGSANAASAHSTSVEVKVLRVRYSL